jgi:hypothetical protein
VPRELLRADELVVARRAGVLALAAPPGGRWRHPLVAERRVPGVDAVVEDPDDHPSPMFPLVRAASWSCIAEAARSSTEETTIWRASFVGSI